MGHRAKTARNLALYRRYQRGESLPVLAQQFALSRTFVLVVVQRVARQRGEVLRPRIASVRRPRKNPWLHRDRDIALFRRHQDEAIPVAALAREAGLSYSSASTILHRTAKHLGEPLRPCRGRRRIER